MRAEKTIAEAIHAKLSDLATAEKSPATIRKWELLLAGERKPGFVAGSSSPTLDEFARDKGLTYLKEIQPEHMNEFRRYWKDGALAASKKRERLRGFFRYCAEQDWIGKNPARLIPSPAVPDDATTPLSEAEPARIWEALPVFIRERKQRARGPESDHLERMGWLLELMLWCGPPILDAVLVTPDQIKKGVLTLRRAKTHTKVPGVPLPPFLSAALDQLPPFPGGSYFWTGKGKPETACGNYRRSIRDLGVAARVSGLHPHRFRNTFTKRLLSQGVPIEDVAKFMGHRSIEVTQRITMPGSTSANLPRAIACARRSRRCSQLIRD